MKSPEPDNTERSERIQELFEAAADLPADEQSWFLAHECGDDSALYESVERLLSADRIHDSSSSHVALALEAIQSLDQAIADDLSGHFGPYRILECIAIGGMSIVYKASRDYDGVSQTVAIKILARELGAPRYITRFAREREILIRLDHPSVVRLLDGGATREGWPYLVMEYFEGRTVDQYVREANLSTEERLKLFLDICAAVQYAHRNLVVHCDLKPANIIVTEDRSVKLLDFGISKILDAVKLTRTATSSVLTPEYSSPEQILGLPITTATDIYSLGVLLYVLISGEPPYPNVAATPQEIGRAVCEQELDIRSSDSIKGDLRSIIAMATRKEPERRYASVEQLAGDVTRYLAKRPVIARPDTLTYRSAVFLRRNWIRTTVVAALVCVLTLSLGASWNESRRAQRRFNDLRGLANFLIFDVSDDLSRITGTFAIRQRLVDRAQGYLDRLESESASDRSLGIEIAKSYLRIARMQGAPYRANAGAPVAALRSLHKAQTTFEELLRRNRDPELNANLSATYHEIGVIYQRQGRLDDAIAMLTRAVEQAAIVKQMRGKDPRYRFLLTVSRTVEAYAEFSRADRYHSLAGFQNVLSLDRATLAELLASSPQDEAWAQNASLACFHTSYAHWRLGDLSKDRAHYEAALQYQTQGLEIIRPIAEQAPSVRYYLRTIADNLNEIGYTLTKLGRLKEAETKFVDSLHRYEAIAAAEPGNVEAEKDVADVCRYYAMSLELAGRKREALRFARRALAIYQRLVTGDPSNDEVIQFAAQCKSMISRLPGR